MRDYLIRQTLAHAARSDAPCGSCGHRVGGHREAPRDLPAWEGEPGASPITYLPNPAHRPGVFACDEPGCACAIEAS